MSHDAGIASAFVVLESLGDRGDEPRRAGGAAPFREAVIDLDAIAATCAPSPSASPPPRSWRSSRRTPTGTARSRSPGGARRRCDAARRRRPRRGARAARGGHRRADPRLAARSRRRLRARRSAPASTSASRALEQLERAAAAASATGRSPSAPEDRHRAQPQRRRAEADWPSGRSRAAAELERGGRLRVRGVFSHLANTSRDDDAAQLAVFERALDARPTAGLEPERAPPRVDPSRRSRDPSARYDLVRIGIGIYGLSPVRRRHDLRRPRPAPGDGARAARVAAVRRVAGGHGRLVRLHLPHAERDDDPRARAARLRRRHPAPRLRRRRRGAARRRARHPVVGRVAMDQFVVDVGDDARRGRRRGRVFGDPATGAPTADDWAEAAARSATRSSRASARGCARRYVGERPIEVRGSSTPRRWRRSARDLGGAAARRRPRGAQRARSAPARPR